MTTRKYGECCHRVAFLDRAANACPECGAPLLRCRAYGECRLLLYRGDHCPSHVAPAVHLTARTPVPARVGGRVLLPIRVENESNCGSDLRVEKLLKREPGGDVEELPQDWGRLRSGESREVRVDSGVLGHAGLVGVDLFLVVSARVGSRRETYAFTAHAPIEVRGEEGAIHVEQAGGDVIVMGRRRPERWSSDRDPGSVRLDTARAELIEERFGLRGYPEGVRVPRTVVVRCVGFPGADAMPPSAPFLGKERLLFGRNGRSYEDPNDVTLRSYLPDGRLDRDLSGCVSGVHFDLSLENDRLRLGPRGRNGTLQNDAPAEDATLVGHGDRIRVPANEPGGPEMEVRFRVRDGLVEEISLTRMDLRRD